MLRIDSWTILTFSFGPITSVFFSRWFPVASWFFFNFTIFIVPLLLFFLTKCVFLQVNGQFLISFFVVPSFISQSSWGRLFFALRSSSSASLMSFLKVGLTHTAVIPPTVSYFSISSYYQTYISSIFGRICSTSLQSFLIRRPVSLFDIIQSILDFLMELHFHGICVRLDGIYLSGMSFQQTFKIGCVGLLWFKNSGCWRRKLKRTVRDVFGFGHSIIFIMFSEHDDCLEVI